MKIEMACEAKGCNCNEGKDYMRFPSESEPGWEDEAIFLCAEHAGKRIEASN